MELDQQTRERIDTLIHSDRVVLFMKGTHDQPQCGFSAATVSILDNLLASYETVNVLADQDIREGIKAYSDWPTIPQLYIDHEFMGGCDVIKQMFNTGALNQALGLPPPDRTPPEIELGEAAAELIRTALADNPGMGVHLSIDAHWNHGLQLAPVEGHEIKATAGGVELLMDVGTAARARGLSIDVKETFAGHEIAFDNPNQANANANA